MKKITIKKTPTITDDTIYDIIGELGRFGKKHQRTLPPNTIDSINKVRSELNKIVNDNYDLFKERTEEFKKLVGRYFKITPKEEAYPYYAFVYQLIEENNTIWMVASTDYRDTWHGGINDIGKTIDGEWNQDIDFEEITEDEWLEFVEYKSKVVYRTRLEKLHNDPHGYNIKWVSDTKFKHVD